VCSVGDPAGAFSFSFVVLVHFLGLLLPTHENEDRLRERGTSVIASIWWTENRVIHESREAHRPEPNRAAVGGSEICE
jgi:hypothetical protein